MRKGLKRVLDRLCTAAGRLDKPTSVRGGLPQRMQALSASTRTRPAR